MEPDSSWGKGREARHESSSPLPSLRNKSFNMHGIGHQNVQPKSTGEANGSEGKWMKATSKTMYLISRLISLLLLRNKALTFRGQIIYIYILRAYEIQ